jgi:rRNA maturation endonuclease Nob1
MDANSGEPWSEADISDLKNELDHGRTIAETASFLCRDVYEVRAKMKELGLTVVKKNVSARAIPIRQAPRRRRRPQSRRRTRRRRAAQASSSGHLGFGV